MPKLRLTKLKKDTKAKVLEVDAGRQAMHRLSMLGLRPGAYITKISAFALNGPVAVKAGQSTIALGYGMADKVIVEVCEPRQ